MLLNSFTNWPFSLSGGFRRPAPRYGPFMSPRQLTESISKDLERPPLQRRAPGESPIHACLMVHLLHVSRIGKEDARVSFFAAMPSVAHSLDARVFGHSHSIPSCYRNPRRKLQGRRPVTI